MTESAARSPYSTLWHWDAWLMAEGYLEQANDALEWSEAGLYLASEVMEAEVTERD